MVGSHDKSIFRHVMDYRTNGQSRKETDIVVNVTSYNIQTKYLPTQMSTTTYK
jgi:hypothetical protein